MKKTWHQPKITEINALLSTTNGKKDGTSENPPTKGKGNKDAGVIPS